MKLSKTNKIVLSCVLAIFLTIVGAFAVIASTNKAKANVNVVDGVVNKTYSLNQTVDFSAVQISVDGVAHTATYCVLEYPDGRAYKLSSFTLSQTGTYTLNCYYEEYSASVSFNVLGNKYNVSSSLSSATFVQDYALPKFNNSTKEVYIPEKPATTTGLKISLANGDEFKLAQPIKFGQGEQSLFKVFPLQETKWGVDEFKRVYGDLTITLTDCYDPNNKVYLEFGFEDNAWNNVYYRAGANTQRKAGLDFNSKQVISSQHAKSRSEVYIGETRCVVYYDQYGTYQGNRLTQTGYEFLFDKETNIVRGRNEGNTYYVSMLSNPDFYGDDLFGGFTTNECYMSIKASNYQNSENANFIISDIYGIDNSELEQTGDNVTYKDTTAPVFELDVPDNIVVAQGSEVPVFDYKCYDVNLVGKPSVALYYNYGSKEQVQITLFDGKFIAKEVGPYSIVYTATDTFGNVGTKVVTINSFEKADGRTISYSVNPITSIVAGKKFLLEDAVNVSSLNGEVEWTKTIEYLEGKTFAPIVVDENGYTMVYDLGKYKISYQFTDGVFTDEYSYEVDAVADGVTGFIGNPVYPSYFMKGYAYSLNKFTAYTFNGTNPTEIQTKVEMRSLGGEYVEIDSEEVLIGDTESVQFRYSAVGVEPLESKVIKVVDCGEGKSLIKSGYLQGEDFNVTYNSGSKRLEAVTDKDGVIEYINPLSLDVLKIQFGILSTASNFDKLTVILKDYYNDANFVEVSYFKKMLSNGVVDVERYFFAVGNTEVEIDNFYVSGDRTFDFAGDNTIRDNDLSTINIAQYLSAFTGDTIRLSFKFSGVSGEAGLYVKQLNYQSFSQSSDKGKPIIYAKDVDGYYGLGETITIGIPETTDVWSPVLSKHTKLSVECPDGTFATSTDGIVLEEVLANREYEFEFSQYGKYKVTYFIMDGAKNNLTKAFEEIRVIDRTAPTLTFTNGFDDTLIQSVAVGDTVSIAGYTVSDDLSSVTNVTVVVHVLAPQGEIIVLTGNTFAVNARGYYHINYQVKDEAGNVRLYRYTIQAK